jgi:hypothetical protein
MNVSVFCSRLSAAILPLAVMATAISWQVDAMADQPAQPVPIAAPVVVPATAQMPLRMPPPVPFAPRPGKIQPDLPIFQKIGPGVFSLGDLQINKPARTVHLPAQVNMSKGLLEYLLVRNGGKMHESLFRTHIDPTQLQLAMLLLGAEGTDQPLSRQGDQDKPKGNPVEITVSYLKDGRMTPLKPESWISRKNDDQMADSEPLHWMFTGSTVSNGKFMAQADGSIIAIYRDPAALIDNASSGGENDRVWYVNERNTPPVGTPVTLTITLKN